MWRFHSGFAGIGSGCSCTTRQLVSTAASTLTGRSSSSGIATTLLAYTGAASSAPIASQIGNSGDASFRTTTRRKSSGPRTGAGAIRAAARGETTIAVLFLHEGTTEAKAGFPVKFVAPCEGTGYEVGSMSLVKGARNLDNAKKFYDWALTPSAQKIGGETKNFQVPSNKATPIPEGAPNMSQIKLINYDFAKYGSAAERKRILDKWDREVYAIPRS